ncbi:MAG: Gfo/Idh/MocA family oxidoreductase [Planctomycetota bacterium]
MRKVRWGIVSTAKIGAEKVIPAMQQCELCEIVAIASRSLDTATAVANQLGIVEAFGSYEALLASPDIDAIYNPLPNHLHVPISLQALEAGKHVLCEKPIALTAKEGQQLVDAANAHPHLKVMEAFMYRHHPQWKRAKQIVENGEIGELRTIQSFFSYFNNDPNNIRNQREMGGGGLMDIGCYNISLSRFLFGRQPKRVMGLVDYDSEMQVDHLASGLLDFGDGSATFSCSMQLTPYQRVNIFGTAGRVEIEIPFNAPPKAPCRIWHERDGEINEIALPICDQYEIQGRLMSEAILNDTPVPTPIEDAVENMRVIEAMFASDAAGCWHTIDEV